VACRKNKNINHKKAYIKAKIPFAIWHIGIFCFSLMRNYKQKESISRKKTIFSFSSWQLFSFSLLPFFS
jgi:hypothetical protein